jgi:hypothetical protein
MTTFNTLMIILVVLLLISLIFGILYSNNMISTNPFLDKHLLKSGLNKPVIWLYYDTSDVNSRNYMDFGARSYRALNMPFLNLCYETIVKQNKDKYRIEVIGGLSGVAELLGGWDALPPGLRDPISPVNEAELNFIRAAILYKYGGLWLSPYTICLKPFNTLPKDKIVFFGTDAEETYSGNEGTPVPGFRCIWAPSSNMDIFKEWYNICYSRIAQKRGGDQIRGDAKWDWIQLTDKFSKNNILIDVHAELMRKKSGKRIQLEDLLATGHSGNLPFNINFYSIYVPIPWTELRDREFYGWFLRMSEKQIMNSDTSIKHLLKMSL